MADNLKLIAPSFTIVAGPSGCGKTELSAQVIRSRNSIYTQPVEKVLFCYKTYQQSYANLERELGDEIVFYQGLPPLDYILQFTTNSVSSEGKSQVLLVFDDLQAAALESKLMCDIAQIYSHHRNASVLLILQNLYAQARQARCIQLSAHYIIAFRNIRDKAQLAYLSRQIYPGRTNLLSDVIDDIAKHHRYPYILLDLSPHTENEEYRIRTRILPHETSEVYLPGS